MVKGGVGVAKVGKAGPIVEKIKIPVEKDPHKLVNYVCGSNIYVEGEDIKVLDCSYASWFCARIYERKNK